MSKKPFLLKPSLLSASVSAALGAMVFGIAPGAYAQDEAAELQEEIVITGSRILRRDFDSNSPISTVDAADFETQTGLNIESYLNQLPEYNPANSPVTTQGDVQQSPTNSVGIASISLRGFGANRSLVLLNGKRPVPINPLMVTDVNNIPSGLLQRVETISGGASAVYGADAVAGVTNFILRDNFEGFEVDTQIGQTEDGEGTESRISAVLGANLGDGRGNVTFGVERYNRDPVLRIDNEFWKEYRENPYTAGSAAFEGLIGINGYDCRFNCAPPATYNALLQPAQGTSVFIPNSANQNRTYLFNSDGTIWANGSPAGFANYNGGYNAEYSPRQVNNGTLVPATYSEFTGVKWNNQNDYASGPQERYSLFASGKFDLTDKVNVYARGTFAESQTRTVGFGFTTTNGSETMVPYNPTFDSPVDPTLNYADPTVVRNILANPAAFANPTFIPTGAPGARWPVPVELAILLNSRPNRAGPWLPRWSPDDSIPTRNTFNTNEAWQVETGMNIDLPFRDWTVELYASHGVSSAQTLATGYMVLGRYRAISNKPDYGRNSKGTGNETFVLGDGTVQAVQAPTNSSGDYTCTSGLYDTFFGGDKPMSADCLEALTANQQNRGQNQQDIIEVNLQGSLFELPAGEVRAAAGFQNRQNSSQFYPDTLLNQDSFTDQFVGLLPVGQLDASTKVDDYYLEALVPVVSDLPFVQMLELELGVRFSDYEHTDEQTTWKALANWEVTDNFRVRGGFNRATRAPNLGELFLNKQELFSFGASGANTDACGLRSQHPQGAGGALPDAQLTSNEPQTEFAAGQTAAGAASTLLICQVMMGGVGSPGANQFYNVGNAGSGQFPTTGQVGNPNLTSETADTWTLGFVATSPWENPWLSGITLNFDAYRIEVEDAISIYTAGYAQSLCFGGPLVTTVAEAQARVATTACQYLPRETVNGGSLGITLSYDNLAAIKTQGFDIGLNWFGDLEELVSLPGRLSASLSATVLDYYKTKATPNPIDVEIDWAGSLGPDLPSTNPGAYDYRLFGSLSYSLNDWSVSLRWRHLPEVNAAAYNEQKAIMDYNAAVAAGAPGRILSYTPIGGSGVLSHIATDSYNLFDMAFNWNINETLTLRGGITNLFNTEPEYTGRSSGVPAGTALASVCSSIGSPPGCQNPTSYQLPSAGGINAGYYDILGRRYFVGLKMSF